VLHVRRRQSPRIGRPTRRRVPSVRPPPPVAPEQAVTTIVYQAPVEAVSSTDVTLKILPCEDGEEPQDVEYQRGHGAAIAACTRARMALPLSPHARSALVSRSQPRMSPECDGSKARQLAA